MTGKHIDYRLDRKGMYGTEQVAQTVSYPA